MRTRVLLIVLLLFAGIAKAQDATGVQFEHGLSWKQIQEKAKKENKYIFVDVFTTWCGPCKLMDRDIFPQEKVGDFFNAHFVNVKVQADATAKDSEEVKKWYKDAQALVASYSIDSYPTFLFFNPQGELVHRLNGGSPTADDFIAKSETALSGYHKQKRRFQSGDRNPEFLLSLVKSAQLMNDRETLPVVANEYLSLQKNLLTEENLKLVALATRKTTDPGFAVLKEHAAKADAVLGAGVSSRMVKEIVFDEVVFPQLMINGMKQDYGGGMVAYRGEAKDKVDWSSIEKELRSKFPDLVEDIMMTSKPFYYKRRKDWPAYTSYIAAHRHKIEQAQLNSYANDVFLFCEDPQSLQKATAWAKELAVSKEKQKP
ncbi:MAG: thioredoxin fold domain-containing protein, partial [Pontibacter sp.]|nr:thioredoxin fold domain-containing protein [Pontibacter sp.]